MGDQIYFYFAKKQRTKVENYLARTYTTGYPLNSSPSAAEHRTSNMFWIHKFSRNGAAKKTRLFHVIQNSEKQQQQQF